MIYIKTSRIKVLPVNITKVVYLGQCGLCCEAKRLRVGFWSEKNIKYDKLTVINEFQILQLHTSITAM